MWEFCLMRGIWDVGILFYEGHLGCGNFFYEEYLGCGNFVL